MDGFTRTAASLVGGVQDWSGWHIKTAADFNGDGKSDILWQHDGDGWPVVWLMDGFTRTAASLVGPMENWATWETVGVRDLNGDGKADILWQGDNGMPVVWMMDGLTRTAAGVPGAGNPGAEWHIIA